MLHGDNPPRKADAPAKVVLKKYGKNRRLYDPSTSRYVNLEEVAALIRNGTEVQVVDSRTGEDLTRVCLMQIIMEDAREKPTGLPLELLRQLVVASDDVGREFIMGYMKSAFDTYQKVQSTLENGLTRVNSAATSPFRLVTDLIQNAVVEKPEESELEVLRRRIAELEKGAQKPKAPRPGKPRKHK